MVYILEIISLADFRHLGLLCMGLVMIMITDKRTDVWSRNFMIWKINFGLWAVAWAGQ